MNAEYPHLNRIVVEVTISQFDDNGNEHLTTCIGSQDLGVYNYRLNDLAHDIGDTAVAAYTERMGSNED